MFMLTRSHGSYVGMHARACAHENKPNYSIIKVFFCVLWWNYHVDCQGWIFVHVYVVEGWKRIPILSRLEQVLSNAILDNLIKVISTSLLQYRGLLKLIWLPN